MDAMTHQAAVPGWDAMLGALARSPYGVGTVVGRLALLALVYAVFTFIQRLAGKRSRLLRAVGLQLNLLGAVSLGMIILEPLLEAAPGFVMDGFLAAVVFLGLAIGLKLLDVLVFEVLAGWRQQSQVPIVVRDIGRWVLALVALVLVVRHFFPGVNLNVLAVSSLVVGYVVGNATQDTLGNLISGLALNTEKPFQLGDWVLVVGHTGQVVDTTWRATRLRTKAEDYIVIPNAVIAKEPILNYSRPTRAHGCHLTLGVSYETPPNKAREAILGVLADAPGVRADPKPSVLLSGYGDFSINFTIKFFIDDFLRLDAIQSGVMDRLWYAFRRAGISIPFPIQEEHQRDAYADEKVARAREREAIHALLASVELFAVLSPSEREQLEAGVTLLPFAAGECLCRQGEAGDSFYVMRTGQVGVTIRGKDGTAVRVASLGPGAFFGEMSLLTGEARAATVTAESDVEVVRVTAADFAGILARNAALSERLAAALETRVAQMAARLAETPGPGGAPEGRQALAARIRRFFGLA
jgi:small-conductance mechanosensitive channel/CRP-like cAMP-binding protein